MVLPWQAVERRVKLFASPQRAPCLSPAKVSAIALPLGAFLLREGAMTDERVVEALTQITDGLEEIVGRIENLERGPGRRNEYGLSDYERTVGWRSLKVALGADPNHMANRFPPEPLAKEPGPGFSPAIADQYQNER